MNNVKPYTGDLGNLDGKLKGEVCVKVLAALRSAELVKAAGGDLKLKVGNKELTETSVEGLIGFFRYLLAVCMADKTPLPKELSATSKFQQAARRVSVFAKLLANSGDVNADGILAALFEKFHDANTYNKLSIAINQSDYKPREKLKVKAAANTFFQKMNEPKVYVFINEGIPNGTLTLNNMLGTISKNNKNAIEEYVGGAKQQIAAVLDEMDFSYTKNASGGNKPSAIMMIGASGAGKTTVIKKVLAVKNNAKSPFTGKTDTRVIIAPRIRVEIKDNGTVLSFDEEKEELPVRRGGVEDTMKDFEDSFARATPFNDKSSRAHHIFKYGDTENPGLLGDLCGTESASDISLRGLGVDIFSPQLIKIFNISSSYNKMKDDTSGDYILTKPAADLMIRNMSGRDEQTKWSAFMGSKKRYEGKAVSIQNLKAFKHSIHSKLNPKQMTVQQLSTLERQAGTANLAQVTTDFAMSVIARTLIVKLTGAITPNVFNEPANTHFGKYTVDKLNREKNTNIVVYVANIIMRCLESMWISRSLDELAMIYDTTKRGQGGVAKTSSTYHVPPGMFRDKQTYKISAKDLPKMATNNASTPYALGVKNTATNLLHLAKLVEPNIVKTGVNATTSSKIHRLFILLKYEGLRMNANRNNPQRQTLKRLTSLVPSKGNAVLKRTQSGSANSPAIRAAVNQLFNKEKVGLGGRGIGIGAMIGTQFKVGKDQTFPEPGSPEFKQMINEIRKRNVSKLTREQEQVARVRLSMLAKIANKTNAIGKIRNGKNTNPINPEETKELRNAINTALRGPPLQLQEGVNATEEDLVKKYALAQNPGGNIKLAMLNSAMGKTPKEVNTMKKQKNRSV